MQAILNEANIERFVTRRIQLGLLLLAVPLLLFWGIHRWHHHELTHLQNHQSSLIEQLAILEALGAEFDRHITRQQSIPDFSIPFTTLTSQFEDNLRMISALDNGQNGVTTLMTQSNTLLQTLKGRQNAVNAKDVSLQDTLKSIQHLIRNTHKVIRFSTPKINQALSLQSTINLLFGIVMLVLMYGLYRWVLHPIVQYLQHAQQHWQSRHSDLLVDLAHVQSQKNSRSNLLSRLQNRVQPLLNKIKSLTELALHEEDPQQVKALLLDTTDQTQILQSLLEKLSDYNQILHGDMTAQPSCCSLREVLHQQLHLVRQVCLNKRIELDIQIDKKLPEHIQLDELLLEKVLSHLLNNAVQYSEGQYVRIMANKIQENRLEIIIEDDGPGLSKNILHALEQSPLRPLDNIKEGLGIGLLICFHLVDAMGGNLSFTSPSHTDDHNRSDSDKHAGLAQTHLVLPYFSASTANSPYQDIHPRLLESKRILWCNPSEHTFEDIKHNFSIILGVTQEQCEQTDDIIPILLEQENQKRPFDLILVCLDDVSSRTVLQEIVADARDHKGLKHEYCMVFLHPDSKLIDESDRAISQLCSRIEMSEFMDKLHQHLFRFMEKISKTVVIPNHATVLIAEDNDINLMVLDTMVKATGVKTTIAKDGKQAFDACHTQSFDLVLMDLQMPVMDGFEATHRIFTELQHTRMPVVAVTANHDFEDRLRCCDVGMLGCMSKPVKKVELIYILSRYLI